jgi:hypothetical protein
MKHNALVFIDIAKKIDKTQYGSITFTIRIHDGYVTDIMDQTYSRKRYQIPKKA